MVVTRGAFRRRLAQIGLAACVVLALAWATYRFTVIPPATFYGHHHPVIDSMLSSRPLLHNVWNSVKTTPLPLSEATMGVLDLLVHNAVGQDSYLLGQWGQSGWWYFFPVVLAVKSPIGLLVLAMCGWWFVLRRWRETPWKQSWQQVLTAVFPLAILLVCMLSRIDLGVRHILPIYPLLAIAGGHAVTALFRHSRLVAICGRPPGRLGRSSTPCELIRIIWRTSTNSPARIPRPSCANPISIGARTSHRLSQRLKQRGIQEFSIAYFGTAPLDQAGLPHYEFLSPTQPTRGYVAASLHDLNIDYKKNGSFAWLKAYQPIERIGKSIDLFYIVPNMTTEYSKREQRGWYLYDWANSPLLYIRAAGVPGAVSHRARQGRRGCQGIHLPVRDSRGCAEPLSLPDQYFGGRSGHFSSRGGRDRGLRTPQEGTAGADGVSRRGRHRRDVFHPGYELHAGSRAADHFQHQLRRVHRGVQLVPARDRSARAARCDFLARVGAGIRGRRRITRPESSAALRVPMRSASQHSRPSASASHRRESGACCSRFRCCSPCGIAAPREFLRPVRTAWRSRSANWRTRCATRAAIRRRCCFSSPT